MSNKVIITCTVNGSSDCSKNNSPQCIANSVYAAWVSFNGLAGLDSGYFFYLDNKSRDNAKTYIEITSMSGYFPLSMEGI